MPKRLAYLGPAGTNTEEAALRYDPHAQLRPVPTFSAVAAAVATGLADEGIVAIENSLEGSVPATLDLLIHESRLAIRAELLLPIVHCLVVKPGTDPESIRVVFSHPQALGQCRSFLEAVYPKVETVAALSTAAAVEEALRSKVPAAAISTKRAAALYGAHILAENILGDQTNVTRFVVLAKEDHPRTGKDKTSIAFAFSEDKAGLLYATLGEFANRGINLTKV